MSFENEVSYLYFHVKTGYSEGRPVNFGPTPNISAASVQLHSMLRLDATKKQKDGYSLPTNSLTNNHISWIWMSKKIGL